MLEAGFGQQHPLEVERHGRLDHRTELVVAARTRSAQTDEGEEGGGGGGVARVRLAWGNGTKWDPRTAEAAAAQGTQRGFGGGVVREEEERSSARGTYESRPSSRVSNMAKHALIWSSRDASDDALFDRSAIAATNSSAHTAFVLSGSKRPHTNSNSSGSTSCSSRRKSRLSILAVRESSVFEPLTPGLVSRSLPPNVDCRCRYC